MDNRYDVVVAGGGPAGSTAATLLAQYGYRVLMIEKDEHPRFHIGESMMPRIAPVMDRLGIDWGEGNLKKNGANFIDEKNARQLFFPLQGKYGTYQIERSAFDKKMFENAIGQGVEAHQREKILQVDCLDDRVEVKSDRAEYRARYFIDATGRQSFMGRKHKTIQRIENLGRFALYRYFQIDESDMPEVEEVFSTGNVRILINDIGWHWVIPLAGRRLSLGLVVQKQAIEKVARPEQLFQQYNESSPLVSALLKNSQALFDMKAEADFSYFNRRRYGSRFACCGDAAGFLDPVFSSGFFFAVKTAELIADRLHQGFVEKREDNPDLHAVDDETFNTGFNTMFLLIQRFYQSELITNLVFEADRHERIKKEITAILAGDLWCEDNLFQQGLLRGRRRVKAL